MHFPLASILFILVLFIVISVEERISSSGPENLERQTGFPLTSFYSSRTSDRFLNMMKANFGMYLRRLPSFFEKYDASLSQAARMPFYWNHKDDLLLYSKKSKPEQKTRGFYLSNETGLALLNDPAPNFEDVSNLTFPGLPSINSRYLIHISPEACGQFDLLEWIDVGGTAAGLVNSLTPLPLEILSSKNLSIVQMKDIQLSKRHLRRFEKKVAIFSSCYAIFLKRINFASTSRAFFSFSELDAPLLSGFKFSSLIQLSISFPMDVSKFLHSNNQFVQSWLPSDFWRSINGIGLNGSDFVPLYRFVRSHYHDLENSFFSHGVRTDTLLQARRTCFMLHRALTSYVWEVDKFPRFPSDFSLNFILLIEKIMIEDVFVKFGTLPSPEEIEISPELAFKILGRLHCHDSHTPCQHSIDANDLGLVHLFAKYLVNNDNQPAINLKRPDLPPLEPVLSRISVEHLTLIPGWPYFIERLEVSLDRFSWRSIPENWFSLLSSEALYPLYDGGCWTLTRKIKSIINPNWKLTQRVHLFSFITTESFSHLGPLQQLNLLVHPDSEKYLSPSIFQSLTIDRFKLLYELATLKGILAQLKQMTKKYLGYYILTVEEELKLLDVQSVKVKGSTENKVPNSKH